jgi:hypothetical protein
MTNVYPRESVEFQPISITVDGSPVTSNVAVAVVADGARPVTWVTPTTLGGQIGVMVGTYAVGPWRVWAQVTSNPEIPVIDCGDFIIT